MRNGDRILWGSNHFFRVNCPKTSSEDLPPKKSSSFRFKVNLDLNSADSSDPATPAAPFDWRMAQEEVMAADLSKNDPLRSAIAQLEARHETDKRAALERQRQEYERHFQQLKSYMSPSTPYPPYAPIMPPPAPAPALAPQQHAPAAPVAAAPQSSTPAIPMSSGRTIPSTPMTMSRLEKWGQER